MESIGAGLKKIRLELGLSLDEVHKKTKIHLDILKAIEEDTIVNLNPVYLKGFLKIYCKFLGLDSTPYLSDYPKPSGRIPPPATMSVKLVSFKPNIIIKTALMVVAIIILGVGLMGLLKTRGVVRATKLPTIQTPKPSASVKVASDSLRLGMRAKDDCWVRLKADGKVVFENILKKGKFESWQAKDRIELSLGNAGVIDLELNGKPLPSLGRRGQVIKNIVVTKEEGLVIPR